MMDSPARAARYARTDAGRAEIQRRAMPLSRAARNLLLTIDTSRRGEDWLHLVRGVAESDLLALIDAGLVAVQSPARTPAKVAAPASPALPRQQQPPAPQRISLAQALQTKSKDVLCRRVLAASRERLSRVRADMLAAEVAQCVTADDIRALALKLVEQTRERDGDQAAITLAQTLIATG